MAPRQCEAVRIVRQAGQGFATFAGFAWVILRMCVDEVTCDVPKPEALTITTVTTVTCAASVMMVMIIPIVTVAGRRYMPRRKGSFLAIFQCGRRQRGIALPSGCKPRFAGFAVRTRQRRPAGVSAVVCGMAGTQMVRTSVRTGFAGLHPAARKRPGTKAQCWCGFAADSLAVLQKSAHEPLRTV